MYIDADHASSKISPITSTLSQSLDPFWKNGKLTGHTLKSLLCEPVESDYLPLIIRPRTLLLSTITWPLWDRHASLPTWPFAAALNNCLQEASSFMHLGIEISPFNSLKQLSHFFASMGLKLTLFQDLSPFAFLTPSWPGMVEYFTFSSTKSWIAAARSSNHQQEFLSTGLHLCPLPSDTFLILCKSQNCSVPFALFCA